ncbi:MAG: polysaccharide biosynthesis/export family protein [Chitinophagaceae bacterium]
MRKRIYKTIVVGVLTSSVFSACHSYKNIAYLKDVSDSANVYAQGVDVAASSSSGDYVVRPGDILSVNVFTKDGRSAAIASGAIGADNNDNTLSAMSSITGTKNSTSGYKVDLSGNIEVPSVGIVHVAGLGIEDAKEVVRRQAKNTFNDPVVDMDVLNFKVTVLGEVNRPGTYLTDGRPVSVLDALGIAGDMTIYGKRENVMMIRKEGDKNHIVRFNLNSIKSLQSDHFYLKQGDVVYVEPTKGKAAANDMAQMRTVSIVSALSSVLIALIYVFIKN